MCAYLQYTLEHVRVLVRPAEVNRVCQTKSVVLFWEKSSPFVPGRGLNSSWWQWCSHFFLPISTPAVPLGFFFLENSQGLRTESGLGLWLHVFLCCLIFTSRCLRGRMLYVEAYYFLLVLFFQNCYLSWVGNENPLILHSVLLEVTMPPVRAICGI